MLSVPNYVVPNPATRIRKLFTNISSKNTTLLDLITNVQTSQVLLNDFKQAVDTIQFDVHATKLVVSCKQRISTLTGTKNRCRCGRGGGGRF